ncbi:hypothetical protein BJ742DRAFT_838803 [Cladochytrium replicatum]|nr:hypothetical protein BJ742DRAFT_838803 [Cladochytrium replicatum]
MLLKSNDTYVEPPPVALETSCQATLESLRTSLLLHPPKRTDSKTLHDLLHQLRSFYDTHVAEPSVIHLSGILHLCSASSIRFDSVTEEEGERNIARVWMGSEGLRWLTGCLKCDEDEEVVRVAAEMIALLNGVAGQDRKSKTWKFDEIDCCYPCGCFVQPTNQRSLPPLPGQPCARLFLGCLSGESLRIQEAAYVEGGLGAHTWMSSVVFARLVHQGQIKLIRSGKVLEIGCGTGISGLAYAKAVSRQHCTNADALVRMTDFDDAVLTNAVHNVRMNGFGVFDREEGWDSGFGSSESVDEVDTHESGVRVEVARLDWIEFEESRDGEKYDVVIGTDVVVDGWQSERVPAVIDGMLSDAGVCYVVLPERERFESERAWFFTAMQQRSFRDSVRRVTMFGQTYLIQTFTRFAKNS